MRFSLNLPQVVILLGGVLSLGLFFHFTPPAQNYPVVLNKQENVGSGLPVRLVIPVINVDAAVEHVGVASDGAMDTPKGPDDVAWFDPGPLPGEIGSAVIDGHSGWKDGKAVAFDNLYKLHTGDKIYVEDGTGTIASFVVREIRSYDPKADDSAVFVSSDGKAHLNLITCEGVWNAASKSYSERLVVFADKET